MKVTVKEVFQDKFTGEHYKVGQVIDVADKKRIGVLTEKGLVEAEAETVAEKPTRKRK